MSPSFHPQVTSPALVLIIKRPNTFKVLHKETSVVKDIHLMRTSSKSKVSKTSGSVLIIFVPH